MAGNDTFVENQISCPYCAEKSILHYPNPNLYRAGRREPDLRVTSYIWFRQECEHLQPHYYAVWQCPHCCYAQLTENIENPKETLKEEYLIAAFDAIPNDKRIVLQELRRLIPEGELNLPGATALHLAAVLVSLLPEEDKRDHHELGRLALRLGWLFREQTEPKKTVSIIEEPPGVLLDSVEQLDGLIREMAQSLGDARRAAEAWADDFGETKGKEENPYAATTAALGDKLAEMRTLLTMLQGAVVRRGVTSIEIVEDLSVPEETYLDKMLTSLKSLWPELPLTENQCLRLAVDAFEFSYNLETTFQSIEQSMIVMRLITNLLFRLGEHERALRFVAVIYKSGTAYKKELQQRIEEGRRAETLRDIDEQRLNRKIGTVNMSILQARESRRQLLDVLIEKHNKIIEKTLSETESKSLAAREQAMRSAGVPDEVVIELKARNILTKGKKKSGFFRG